MIGVASIAKRNFARSSSQKKHKSDVQSGVPYKHVRKQLEIGIDVHCNHIKIQPRKPNYKGHNRNSNGGELGRRRNFHYGSAKPPDVISYKQLETNIVKHGKESRRYYEYNLPRLKVDETKYQAQYSC